MKKSRSAFMATALVSLSLGAQQASAQEPGAFAAQAYTTPLAEVCPDPFIVQKDWLAQAEHGALYQMIGGAGTMESGRYTGPLGSTGIDLVILEGGGGMGLGDGETAYSSLYMGNSKAGLRPHLGYQELDNAFIFSKRFPVVGVAAPLNIAPQGLFWDRGTYPEGFKSIEDIIAFAESGKGMIYVSTIQRTFGLYLVQSGVPRDAFVEGYRGDGENFVTNNGTWLNQGFVTSEPFAFSTGNNWGKPIDAVTVGELGYPNYSGMLSVATDRMDELAPCLEKLVPIIQQAVVDYMDDPTEVLETIHEFTQEGYATSWWKLSMDKLEFGWKTLKEQQIMGNGSNDVVADFDENRIATMFEIVSPWLDERALEDLDPQTVVTNRFIDPSIGLK